MAAPLRWQRPSGADCSFLKLRQAPGGGASTGTGFISEPRNDGGSDGAICDIRSNGFSCLAKRIKNGFDCQLVWGGFTFSSGRFGLLVTRSGRVFDGCVDDFLAVPFAGESSVSLV